MIETLIGADKSSFYGLANTGIPTVLACFVVVYLFTGKINP